MICEAGQTLFRLGLFTFIANCIIAAMVTALGMEFHPFVIKVLAIISFLAGVSFIIIFLTLRKWALATRIALFIIALGGISLLITFFTSFLGYLLPPLASQIEGPIRWLLIATAAVLIVCYLASKRLAPRE